MARRTSTWTVVAVIAGALVLAPLLLVASGAAGDEGVRDWLGDRMLDLGIGDVSRIRIRDARGELDVQLVHDEVVRVRLDGVDVPPERLRRDGDTLVVLREDGTIWGEVPLAGAGGPFGADSLEEADPETARALAELGALVRAAVASRMERALGELDPPLPLPATADLAELVRRAAAECLDGVDRTVIGTEPDASGATSWTVRLDADELVEGFADAFEDEAAGAGLRLEASDVTRVRAAVSRAGADLRELEFRTGG